LNTFSEGNKERIRLLARQTRFKHKAMEWGVPPTYLIEKQGLDYGEYDLNDNGFWARAKNSIKNRIKEIAKRIKAAIVVPERIVLIDTDLHPSKKPFGQGHELGHNEIPEHREILYVCSEHDLNPATREQMEFEANIFASELLFPTPLMESIYTTYPVSMETILHLNELSGASIHSAAIRYVIGCDKECCLLTLDAELDDKGNSGLRLKHITWSNPWWKKHKRLIADHQFFPPNHNLSLVVFSGQAEAIVKNTVTVGDERFNVHSFYNKYKVLALLF
jgi:hypothetical protein